MTDYVHRTCRRWATEIEHIIGALSTGEAQRNCNGDNRDFWADS